MGSKTRYALALVIACAASMLISYQTVRYLTRDSSIVYRPPAARIEEARYARQQSNHLTQSLNNFFARMPETGPIPDQITRRWIDRQFVPDILQIKRGLEGSSGSMKEQYRELAGAAGLAQTLAQRADDPAQRVMLGRQIAEALTDLNSWLATEKLGLYIHEERVLPLFGDAP